MWPDERLGLPVRTLEREWRWRRRALRSLDLSALRVIPKDFQIADIRKIANFLRISYNLTSRFIAN
jgi:hypothetical protein